MDVGRRAKQFAPFAALRGLDETIRQAEAVKKCVEQAVQPEQGKEKTQNKRRDMEL